MSLRKNIIANYASQIYVTLVGIIMVPLYIKYMGAETYGLVGFYAMLQAWFTLLDMGLSPTVSRETARFHGGSTTANDYRRLVRALEGVFIVIAIVGGGSLFMGADAIASQWLTFAKLPLSEVATSLHLISVIVAFRWTCGLYRGVITGSQRLVWLSGFNVIIATLRFGAVIPWLIYVGSSPIHFFLFQFFVAIFELTVLVFFAYRLLPMLASGQRIKWEWAPLKPVLKFSLTIAFTSAVWVMVTQTDKLVLSKLLSLSDYGHYALGVLAAGAVLFLGGPVSSAIIPYMAKLEAQNDQESLIKIYRQATQLVAVLVGSAAITMAFFSNELLSSWTGDRFLADKVAPILSVYALGNGILAISAFPSYLQYAKGNMRLHLQGNAIFLVIFVPLIVWSASNYGAAGAARTWLLMNSLSFFVWLPLVHKKFSPGLNRVWYSNDTLFIVIPMVFTGMLLSNIIDSNQNRVIQAAIILLCGMLVMATGVMASSYLRIKIKEIFLNFRGRELN